MREKIKKQESPQRKVLIIGGDSLYRFLLQDMGLEIVSVQTLSQFKDKVPELDLVMFTGGADVDPVLYGGIHTNVSYIQPERDKIEEMAFNLCLKHNVKVTGICRGFQFLNVMCGGKMYQHINNHGGISHEVIYPATGNITMVTSTHHQLVMLPGNAVPVAWSHPINRSDVYIGPDTKSVQGPAHEMESAIFPEYNTFGVQFHPEMMGSYTPGRVYYQEMLANFLGMHITSFTRLYGYTGEDNGEDHGRREDQIEAGRGAAA